MPGFDILGIDWVLGGSILRGDIYRGDVTGP